VTNFTGWLKYSVIRIITEIRHVLSYWLAWGYWRFSSAGQTDTAHTSPLYASLSDDETRKMFWNLLRMSVFLDMTLCY
jgi:hypothetical protein